MSSILKDLIILPTLKRILINSLIKIIKKKKKKKKKIQEKKKKKKISGRIQDT